MVADVRFCTGGRLTIIIFVQVWVIICNYEANEVLNHLISSILISVFFPCHPAVSDSLLLKPLAENLVRNALVGMAQQGGPYPMTTSFGVSASGIWWCKTPMLHGAQCSSRSKMRFCKFAVKDFADCILTSKGGDELCEFLQPHWG